ncbi:COP9 signalosome complex subunit 2, partial [Smittium mucronatum]
MDPNWASQLLEIYGIELEMYSNLERTHDLERSYSQCIQINSAVPHPKLMGLVRETGGKIFARKSTQYHLSPPFSLSIVIFFKLLENWDKALSEFFESFKCYEEAGSPSMIKILKYLILVGLLSGSTVSLFDTPETKSYENNPEILIVNSLASAYQSQDLDSFNNIINTNPEVLENDPFMKMYVSDISRSMQNLILVTITKPYSRVPLTHLAASLGVDDVVEMLANAIMDGQLPGFIDEQDMVYTAVP